ADTVADTEAGVEAPVADATGADATGADATTTASDDGAPDQPKPPPPTTLLLARHAVTAETGSMLSGRKPGIDLSDKGREQAEALAARLASLPLKAVYASPIERTMQTAAPVAAQHGLDVRELP